MGGHEANNGVEAPADGIIYVIILIYTFRRGEEGFNQGISSTYTSRRDGCAPLPTRFHDMNTTIRSGILWHSPHGTQLVSGDKYRMQTMVPEANKTAFRRKARGISRYIVL